MWSPKLSDAHYESIARVQWLVASVIGAIYIYPIPDHLVGVVVEGSCVRVDTQPVVL